MRKFPISKFYGKFPVAVRFPRFGWKDSGKFPLASLYLGPGFGSKNRVRVRRITVRVRLKKHGSGSAKKAQFGFGFGGPGFGFGDLGFGFGKIAGFGSEPGL